MDQVCLVDRLICDGSRRCAGKWVGAGSGEVEGQCKALVSNLKLVIRHVHVEVVSFVDVVHVTWIWHRCRRVNLGMPSGSSLGVSSICLFFVAFLSVAAWSCADCLPLSCLIDFCWCIFW